MFLIFLMTMILLIWAYILFLRPILVKTFPDFGRFTKIEAALFKRSRTILVARGYWIGGILIAAHEIAAAAGLDATPIMNEVAKFIPEQYRGLAIAGFVFITGFAIAWLRKVTTTPVGEA